MDARKLNRRRMLVAAFGAGVWTASVPVLAASAQAPAEVELVDVTDEDDDFVYMNGGPLAVFTIYRGGITVKVPDREYRELVEGSPIKTFTAMAVKSREEGS